ncbi:MAG TPA: 50S ribosomal protein L18 [Acidobacteriota bacterium]|nr:50S ribosomal protein L18 [Acidobacteriota bacterium]HNB69867.1 50S ribosomal protein L18 [Acidobacteriota bacterium]HND19209.1 50S ribosomal protein L18 [Acidobacteriota bacterium]HNH82005.1 50S ribosomal protein L18 [Acidobacteriota bacterium]HNJ40262.1 50S ribosomal protein L18 [Acidobacteriota bacterium]
MALKERAEVRKAIHRRIRKKVFGTPERPRLCVFRSLKHITVQIIDDSKGETLCSASTVEKTLREQSGGNIQAAEAIGKLIATRAKEKGIDSVVFDRGGYIYHGRVRHLAEAAREAGLKF